METFVSNDVKTGDNSLSQSRAKFAEEALLYADSSLAMRDIAKLIGCSYHCVRDIYMVQPWYHKRVARLQSESSKGQVQPKGKASPSFRGGTTTHERYKCWKNPDWFKGRKSTGNTTTYVFEHQLIVATELGWDRIPDGWCVHHIDQNKLNNSLSNLTLIPKDDHNLLHGLLRKGVTTIPIRKYTQVGGSASLWSFSPPDEDIVCSCWQQQAG